MEMTMAVVQDAAVTGEGPSVLLNSRQLMAGDLRVWRRIWAEDRHEVGLTGLLQNARLVWNQCGLRATLLYRISHGLSKSRVPVLPGILSRLNIVLYGFDVPPSVEIGPGLYMPHPVGTVIMATRLGANVSLISSITIGMRNVYGFPTIGDGVFIGAGARILGDITIGDNANIGANAVVLQDIPAGATAVGVPARVLPVKKATA